MISLVLVATLSFDANMSEKELKETGLSKLTVEERLNLRTFVDKHYTSKTKIKGPILHEVLKGGKYVRLSDQSLWEIEPQDTLLTQSWITAIEIKITENADQEYTLTNSLTGTSVKARKVEKI